MYENELGSPLLRNDPKNEEGGCILSDSYPIERQLAYVHISRSKVNYEKLKTIHLVKMSSFVLFG